MTETIANFYTFRQRTYKTMIFSNHTMVLHFIILQFPPPPPPPSPPNKNPQHINSCGLNEQWTTWRSQGMEHISSVAMSLVQLLEAVSEDNNGWSQYMRWLCNKCNTRGTVCEINTIFWNFVVPCMTIIHLGKYVLQLILARTNMK